MSQKKPLFCKQSKASLRGLQTGFPLDISIVWLVSLWFICLQGWIFISIWDLPWAERGPVPVVRGLCCQGSCRISTWSPLWVLFLPVGTWRHAFLGTAAESLIPSAPCAVGACGWTMWCFINVHEWSWLTSHKCFNWSGPQSLQNYPKLKSGILSQAVSNLPCHGVSSSKLQKKCKAQDLCRPFSKHCFKDLTLGCVGSPIWKIVSCVPLQNHQVL